MKTKPKGKYCSYILPMISKFTDSSSSIKVAKLSVIYGTFLFQKLSKGFQGITGTGQSHVLKRFFHEPCLTSLLECCAIGPQQYLSLSESSWQNILVWTKKQVARLQPDYLYPQSGKNWLTITHPIGSLIVNGGGKQLASSRRFSPKWDITVTTEKLGTTVWNDFNINSSFFMQLISIQWQSCIIIVSNDCLSNNVEF